MEFSFMKPFCMVMIMLIMCVPALAQTPREVTVLYAGSLVTPMEGQIKEALRSSALDFQGQPGGSKALAHLIDAGLKKPDIFISVDPSLVRALGDKVLRSVTFARTSLGIGWSDQSKDAQLFERVAKGQGSLLDALATPGLRIGRTDPALDPKGAYTVLAMKMLAGDSREGAILGDDNNAMQVFPEEDLLVRVEGGEADVGFFYRTEAIARGLHFIALPGNASLRDRITYTIATMRDAPHPQAAAQFMDYVLTGGGKPILEKAGLEYGP